MPTPVCVEALEGEIAPFLATTQERHDMVFDGDFFAAADGQVLDGVVHRIHYYAE